MTPVLLQQLLVLHSGGGEHQPQIDTTVGIQRPVIQLLQGNDQRLQPAAEGRDLIVALGREQALEPADARFCGNVGVVAKPNGKKLLGDGVESRVRLRHRGSRSRG